MCIRDRVNAARLRRPAQHDKVRAGRAHGAAASEGRARAARMQEARACVQGHPGPHGRGSDTNSSV
eukprot:7776731-Alexandrium_andersonii.AAC.1